MWRALVTLLLELSGLTFTSSVAVECVVVLIIDKDIVFFYGFILILLSVSVSVSDLYALTSAVAIY